MRSPNTRSRSRAASIGGVILTLAATAWSPVEAQSRSSGGSCPRVVGFECQMATQGEGKDAASHDWIRYVILWRKPLAVANSMGFDSTEYARFKLAQRAENQIAEDMGRSRSYGGTGVYSYSHMEGGGRRPGGPDTLFVSGEQFIIPTRDSALVVLVDGFDGPGVRAVVVGSTYISAEISSSFWPKHWMNGDTTFTVTPRNRDQLFRQALSVNPKLRAFLATALVTRDW